MGRPLPRKMFGPLDASDTSPLNNRWTEDGQDQHSYDTTSSTEDNRKGFNIPVDQARIIGGDLDIGAPGETPYILWQKSAKRFRVRTSSGDGFCKLVDNDGSSEVGQGEMVLKGYVDGEGDGIIITKISGRKAYDSSGNAYKWYVGVKSGEDSTLGNTIILTAI